jgi:hypothetical protein
VGGCSDAGAATNFPDDVIRLASWSTAIASDWKTEADRDERPFLSGPVQIPARYGFRILTAGSGEKKIGIDTAVVGNTQRNPVREPNLLCGIRNGRSPNVLAAAHFDRLHIGHADSVSAQRQRNGSDDN